jgi:hypothetical protein
LINSYVKTKESEVKGLKAKKEDIITYWKSLSLEAPEYPIAKFRIINEQNRILLEIINMARDSENEVLELTTSVGIIQEDTAEVFDSIIGFAHKNPKVNFRILANITKENMVLIEKIVKTLNIASRKDHGCERSHFVVFPEYTIPGLKGINVVQKIIEGASWEIGTIVVGGVDGLRKNEYATLCEQSENVYDGGWTSSREHADLLRHCARIQPDAGGVAGKRGAIHR